MRGFVVPTDTKGYSAQVIEPKMSMRASIQCEIHLNDLRLPESAMLPAETAVGLGGPFRCLNEARYGINRGYLLAHQIGRLKDSMKDSAGAAEQATGLPHGSLLPATISTGKLDNTRVALTIAREARAMLGGNGISLEYSPLRHANNLESVRTYEGTDEVHQLTIGRHLTGPRA